MHESDITRFLGYTTISGVQPRPPRVYDMEEVPVSMATVDASRTLSSFQTNQKRVVHCRLRGVADSEPRKGAPGITPSAARVTLSSPPPTHPDPSVLQSLSSLAFPPPL
ncbi:hypothetical protein AMELA_G00151890 [Ameiurus melas]|uniref:Uncharacterized protein n=1 Tax=Ameiurus melas TaxID=219545 RepID=A0A7J6AHR4_AMEME|nr:hypothetical protein AMELA_G00151890 [Ameiurus melas]